MMFDFSKNFVVYEEVYGYLDYDLYFPHVFKHIGSFSDVKYDNFVFFSRNLYFVFLILDRNFRDFEGRCQ